MNSNDPEQKMGKLNNGIEITYFGHSTFLVKSPTGKYVLIDPWIKENPSCPDNLKILETVDIMAITHGHFDHISDAVQVGIEHNPTVIANWEICDWLGTKGIKNCSPMNKGGAQVVEGIKFVMTQAQHSSGIKEEDGSMVYGGEPGGYLIEFENGYKIYHAGDTNIFGDMKLIGEIYGPELIMIPIGDLFTMSPLEASYACKLLNPQFVIPMHYATFPALTGTPQQLKELTKNMKQLEIVPLAPGEKLS